MTVTKRDVVDPSQQRQAALARWDTEGGAGPDGPQAASLSGKSAPKDHSPTTAELAQLHSRVIALENLVIALLAEASDRQLGLVCDMAAFISPRPGCTRHPLTIHAAAQMVNIVERAEHFRGTGASP